MTGKTKSSLLPACCLIASLIIFAFLTINTSYAQEYSNLDSLKNGVKYKIILFDETEIVGKVISQDSVYMVISEGLTKTRIRKDDIFTISRDLKPSKYLLMFSLGGGASVLSGEFYNDHYKNFKPRYSLQANSVFFTGKNRAIRIDMGYSRFRRTQDYSYSPYYTSWSGGDLGMLSFKVDYMYGDLDPASTVNFYAALGIGMHITREEEYKYTYYSSYDSSYYTHTIPASSKTNLVIGLGGGFAFKFSKHFGAYAEVQYNVVTYGGYLIFGFGTGYFPIRAGVTYTLF